MSATRRGRTLFHPFRAARGDAERLRALLAAQTALAGEHELEDLLRTALEHALAFTGLAAGLGLVQTASGDRVVVRAVAGDAQAGGVDRLAVGSVARSPLLTLYEQGTVERRVLQHPVPHGDAPPRAGGSPAAYLLLPLTTARRRPLGALFLAAAEYQQPLAPEDVEVLQAIAGTIAPAVENTQLHDQLERSLDELLTLYGAGQAISSSLEIREVLDGILEMGRRLTHADCCLITGVDDSGQAVVLAESGGTAEWLAYRGTQGARLTISAVLRDGTLRPLGLPPVTGWCIGLKVHQRVIGTLEVYSRGAAPRYDESHLLNGLATQAAIAIENAKLYQEVREKERHLQDLVERMIQAQEEEQRRVAYDIHDGLAQLMVSAHQHLQTFGMLHQRQDPRADSALAKGLFMLQKSIEEVRKVIAGLRPAELDDLGLVPALQLYVQSLRDDLGWQVDLVESAGKDRMPATVEVTAYRIIQEALTNARRHGEAKRARVELRREGNSLHIEVRDWGSGFDAAAMDGGAPRGKEAGRHVGLHGMRERAYLLNGTFEIESAVGQGTTVRVSLPIPEGADPATPFPFNFNGSDVATALPEEEGLHAAEDHAHAVVSGGAVVSTGGAFGHWPAGSALPARAPGAEAEAEAEAAAGTVYAATAAAGAQSEDNGDG
jgi:signal transduction histidine kinase